MSDLFELTTHVAWNQIVGGRDYQEDHGAVESLPDGARLLVLADGMGGEVGGARASAAAVAGFRDSFLADESRDVKSRLHNALDAANQVIGEVVRQEPDLWGMGTTLVGLVFDGAAVRWISVGDSPLWLYRRGGLKRLNQNHSVAGELDARAARGEITRAQAESAVDRHRLLEAVMGQPITLVDAPDNPTTVSPGDILLLASDGVETCSTAELKEILASADKNTDPSADAPSADGLVDAILRRIEAHGREYQDNATVMVMAVVGENDDEPTTALPPIAARR